MVTSTARPPRGARGCLPGLNARRASSPEARSRRRHPSAANHLDRARNDRAAASSQRCNGRGLDNESTITAGNSPRACLERLPRNREKPRKARPLRERLKGFEPSTFCMASRTYGSGSAPKSPANRRVLSQECRSAIPRLSPRNHAGLGTERAPGRPRTRGRNWGHASGVKIATWLARRWASGHRC